MRIVGPDDPGDGVERRPARLPLRSARGSRGQGVSEYILIIGLIVIAIIVSLLVFRNSVEGFIQRTASWFDAFLDPKPAPPPPPAHPPPNPLDSLTGSWCWYWINPDGSETLSPTPISINQSASGDIVWSYDNQQATLESSSPGSFYMQGHPEVTYQMGPDGSIRPSDRTNVDIKRCQ